MMLYAFFNTGVIAEFLIGSVIMVQAVGLA